MKKIVRLTERDLTRLVKKIIKEDVYVYMDYEERLDKMKNILDDIEILDNPDEIEMELKHIRRELYSIENDIDRDNDLNDEEKGDLLDYVGELIVRIKPKRRR